jgi:DNA-binding phage protein
LLTASNLAELAFVPVQVGENGRWRTLMSLILEVKVQDAMAASRELRERLRGGLAQKRGLTVSTLAVRSELGRTTVWKALSFSGRVPSERTVGHLARALGLDADLLLRLQRTACMPGADGSPAPAVSAALRRPTGSDPHGASARRALTATDGLDSAVAPATSSMRRITLDRLFTDLESIHRDYLKMFDAVLEQTPDSWERGMPHFPGSARSVAAVLRRVRLAYEPVRVRVRAVAETFSRAPLPALEHAFVAAVLAYFPTGELRSNELTERVQTSGTAVLDHLYRSLDGELGPALGVFLRDTLAFHRERWSEVCLAHAALQLYEQGPEG